MNDLEFSLGPGHLSFLCKYLLVPAIVIRHFIAVISNPNRGHWYNSHFAIEESET